MCGRSSPRPCPTGSAPSTASAASRWAETERRANGVAQFLLDLGVAHQDKVAHYLYNCPEYMESTFAILKVGLVPVNTNYRYTDDELVYLWDNADAVAVIFHGAFSERIAGLRARVPRVRAWLWVDDGTDECPPWATPYEARGRRAEPTRPTATVGPHRRRPLLPLHRGNHGDAQGRHVAPGRPVLQAQRREPPAGARGRGHRRRPQDHRGRRAPPPPGLSPHARHRAGSPPWRP